MKNLLTIALLLLLTACAGSIEESSPMGNDLFIDYPIGVVQVRLHNTSQYDIDAITTTYGDTTHEFGMLAKGETTDFVEFPYIFQGFNGEITINGEAITNNIRENVDMTGEPPITGGSYTFQLDGKLDQGYFGGQLMPNEEVGLDRLKPLIDLLSDGGLRVDYTRSAQRENFFDMEYGVGTAAQELMDVDGERMIVFVFGDTVSAETAAELVAEKGQYISINLWSGKHPVWWQKDNILLLTEGQDTTHHQAITQALTTTPIGGEPAAFVPTPTPPTPDIDSDTYMARLNYDPDGYNSALLTGDLNLNNNCVFIGDNLIIWPRRYTFDDSGILPAVLDENGDVVFTVGEKAYVGGSGTSMIDFSDRQDQLVDPIPDSCDAKSVWFASGALPKEYRDEAVGTTDHALIYTLVAQEVFNADPNAETVIRNRTTRQGVPGYLPDTVDALNVSAETLDNYHLVNGGMKDIDQAFANNDRFMIAYPSEETESDIALTFSDIGFNQAKTEGLLLAVNDCGAGQGNPCATHYIHLTKTDENWQIQSIVDG